ncbi:MAG: signal recognition particle-docking protein FtsY [Rhabdochlamydiaceae bacterium]
MFGFFKKIKSALTKTRSFLGSRLKLLFGSPLTEEAYEKLEQILYEADIGSIVTEDLITEVKKFLKYHPHAKPEEIIAQMEKYAEKILSAPPKISPKQGHPQVILIVGINGSGKTTSIAKLAAHFKGEGKKVLVAAADTFRAGAIDQLILWSEKLGIEIVKAQPGSDPSSVAFDALTAASKRNLDIVLIDTAGRLQNKTDLMQELEKIRRVCTKVILESPHEVLLVLDATTGQNAVEQAKIFNQYTPLTGIILTKLDGSAKGGVVLPIYKELGIPIQWVGVGEKMDDLIPFDQKSYLSGLFENNS